MGSSPDEPGQLAAQPAEGRDVLALGDDERLGAGDVRHADEPRLGRDVGVALAQLRLELRPAPQPAGDLALLHLARDRRDAGGRPPPLGEDPEQRAHDDEHDADGREDQEAPARGPREGEDAGRDGDRGGASERLPRLRPVRRSRRSRRR